MGSVYTTLNNPHFYPLGHVNVTEDVWTKSLKYLLVSGIGSSPRLHVAERCLRVCLAVPVHFNII